MYSEKFSTIRSEVLKPIRLDGILSIKIPLYATYISAGFPSPADDYIEDQIDLGRYLVQNPTSTYLMRVKGNSMVDANIHDGDILVIDKALKPENGLPVICFLDGEFTVKAFKKIKDKAYLMPANPDYRPIEVSGEMNMGIWGVVVWILHKPVKQ